MIEDHLHNFITEKIKNIGYNSINFDLALVKEEGEWKVLVARIIFDIAKPQEQKTLLKKNDFVIEHFSQSIHEFERFYEYLNKSDITRQQTVESITSDAVEQSYKIGNYSVKFKGNFPSREVYFLGRQRTKDPRGIDRPIYHIEYYLHNSVTPRSHYKIDLSGHEIPFSSVFDAINEYWNASFQQHQLSQAGCGIYMPIYDASIADCNFEGNLIIVKIDFDKTRTKISELSIGVRTNNATQEYNKRHNLQIPSIEIDVGFTPTYAIIYLNRGEEKLDEYYYTPSSDITQLNTTTIQTQPRTERENSENKVDYLIKKFDESKTNLQGLKNRLNLDLHNLSKDFLEADQFELMTISKRIRNLLKVGYDDGKERSESFSKEEANFYHGLNTRNFHRNLGRTLEEDKFLQHVRWHEMKINEFLDELKIIKESIEFTSKKTKTPKLIVKNTINKFQKIRKQLDIIQDEINHIFDNGDLAEDSSVLDISEKLFKIIDETFPDGKSRVFKIKREYDKTHAQATDYYASTYLASDSAPDGIYIYTHRKLLEFLVEQIQKTINDINILENKSREYSEQEIEITEYLDSNIHPDPYFKKLISEINKCYSTEMYGPAVERIRKLFENLVIDILKKKYQNDTSTYITSNDKHYPFHIIVKNTLDKIKQGDFNHVKQEFEESLKWMSHLRSEGSKSTHSITFDISEDYLNEIKSELIRNVELLIRVFGLIK